MPIGSIQPADPRETEAATWQGITARATQHLEATLSPYLKHSPDKLNLHPTVYKSTYLPWIEFGWAVADALVLPIATGRTLRYFGLPSRSLNIFLGQAALGMALGAFRGAVISYARQSEHVGPFDWAQFKNDVAVSAIEGGFGAFGSLGAGLLSYLRATQLPTKLVPILHTGLDMLINEGLSGAGVGAARFAFGKEDDLQGAMLSGLALGLGFGGAFRVASHGGLALGRRTVGEFLYRDFHYQRHLIQHHFTPGTLPWRQRNELPRGAPLEAVHAALGDAAQPIPLWIQPTRAVTLMRPLGLQNPYSNYRGMIAGQEKLTQRITGIVSDLRTHAERGDTLRMARGQQKLRRLLPRLIDNYARYAYVLSDGGQQSGLLTQHLAHELRLGLKHGDSDRLPSVLSITFDGIKDNNDKIGHVSQDFLLQATFRAYHRYFAKKLDWTAQRLSGITEQGRVNLSCLLNPDEFLRIRGDLYYLYTSSVGGEDSLPGELIGELNSRIVSELEAMIPYTPGRLRKRGAVVEIRTDAAPGRPAGWIAAQAVLLRPSFGVVNAAEAIDSLRTLAKPEASWWRPARHRPALSEGKLSDSGELREEDLFADAQHAIMASLDVAERAKSMKRPLLEGIAHVREETLGRSFMPAGAYLSDEHLQSTLVDIFSHYVDKAGRSDPFGTLSAEVLEDSLYFERLVEKYLKQQNPGLANPEAAERLSTETARLIETFRSCDFAAVNPNVHAFKIFIDRSYQELRVGDYNSVTWFAKRAGLLPREPHDLVRYADRAHGLLNWLKRLSLADEADLHASLGEWDNALDRNHYAESYEESLNKLARRMERAMADPRNPDNLKAPFWASETMAMLERAQWMSTWRYEALNACQRAFAWVRARVNPDFSPRPADPISVIKLSADGDEIRSGILALDKHGKPKGLMLLGIEGDGVKDFNTYFGIFKRHIYDRFVAFHRMLKDTMRFLRVDARHSLHRLGSRMPGSLEAVDDAYRFLLNRHYGESYMPTTRTNPATGERGNWMTEAGNRRWAPLGASGLGGRLDTTLLAFQPEPDYIVRRRMDDITGALDDVKKDKVPELPTGGFRSFAESALEYIVHTTTGRHWRLRGANLVNVRGRTVEVFPNLHPDDWMTRDSLHALPDQSMPIREGNDTEMF